MTCKDCLHCDWCKKVVLAFRFGFDENAEGMENRCEGFEKRGNWICLLTDIGKPVYAVAEPCGGCRHYDELPTKENVEACRNCKKREVIRVNFYYDLIPEYGKTVFLTAKEAEDTLAKMQ